MGVLHALLFDRVAEVQESAVNNEQNRAKKNEERDAKAGNGKALPISLMVRRIPTAASKAMP